MTLASELCCMILSLRIVPPAQNESFFFIELRCWRQRLLGRSVEERAHLDRRPAGDDGFASPFERLVGVGAPEDPEAADVLLGFEVWPVGDQDVALGPP